jgi:hypothetical protein
MRLGELLVVNGVVTPTDIETALERQKRLGGPIGGHLIAMGVLTEKKLWEVLPGLQRWQTRHGPNHPNTYRARYSYARALLAAGRPAEALRNAEAALTGYRVTVGEKHPWAIEAIQLIAEASAARANLASQVAGDVPSIEPAKSKPQPIA